MSAESVSIPLLGVGGTPSSSEETLYQRGYGSIHDPKVHRGVGRNKIPIQLSAAGAHAGEQYQQIFEGQLGAAAADPNNPVGDFFYRLIYGEPENPDKSTYTNVHGTYLNSALVKPKELKWNKETREKYRDHWKLEKAYRKQQKPKEEKPKQEPTRGLTLPFSNNIGPGNSIQPALTRADLIAQGHDLHYQDAKKDSDVLSADREAIGQFAQEAISGTNPISQLQALAGAAGLGAKHLAESLTGKVFYGNYVFTIS